MKPKDDFIGSKNKLPHEAWVGTEAATAARDAAMLEFVARLPDAIEPGSGALAHAQLCGARRMLDILFTLHLQEEPRKFVRMPNLAPPS